MRPRVQILRFAQNDLSESVVGEYCEIPIDPSLAKDDIRPDLLQTLDPIHDTQTASPANYE
jgi:hypothetical protein